MRAPWRAGSGWPVRRGNARARGVSGRPLIAPPAHPRPGKHGWVRGCRESSRGPHPYLDTSPGKELEGSLEKARGCWLPLPPFRPPALVSGVIRSCLMGWAPLGAGLGWRSLAASITAGLQRWRVWYPRRGGGSGLQTTPAPSRVPGGPRCLRGPGGREAVRFGPRPRDCCPSSCGAGRVSGRASFGMTQSSMQSPGACAALPICDSRTGGEAP